MVQFRAYPKYPKNIVFLAEEGKLPKCFTETSSQYISECSICLLLPNLPLSLRTVSSAEISMTYTSFPCVGEKNIWRKTENNFTARMCGEIWTRHLEHMETWGQLEQLFTHEWDETIYATRKFLLQQHFLLILVISGKNWNKILCDLAGTVFSWEIKFSENLITERELWWNCLTGSVWRSWLALAKLHTRKKAS